MAERAARRYGLDMASAAGVYAALGPQKQWDENVYLGDRLIDIAKTKHAEKWDEAMTRSVDAWVDGALGPRQDRGHEGQLEAQRAIAAKLIGKSYDDLDDPAEKAFWVFRALYNDATPADRKLWAGWYEGAHKVAERAARKYGLDLASAAGVYAALSPQAQWDRNVYLGAAVDRMKDNLRALYNDATPADRKLWAGWYEGAHKVAERAARKYGLDLASAAGVYAALSPQAQWDRNVYLGDRLIDIVETKHAEKWDEAMTRSVDAWVTARSGRATTEGMKANSEAQRAIAAKLIGKSYDDLDDPAEKAFWVRAYDEAHSDRTYPVVGIDGDLGETMKNADGTPSKAAWQSTDMTANAITALGSNGDRAKISEALGDKHKVRSFYNNILDPASDNNDVTIGTHAVGAAWLGPGRLSAPVAQNLGTNPKRAPGAAKEAFEAAPSSGVSGIKGAYPVYAQAYRELAEELKLKPRQLQSIVWEQKIKR